MQQIDARAAHQSPPLGKWLEEDLIETGYEEVGGIHRRGAALLGIPETTFRRKMKQIYARTAIGGVSRTPEWQEIKDLLPRLVQLKNPTHEDWVVKSRYILLRHVVHRFGDRTSVIASLMGVTEPTILRWRQKLD